MPSSGGGLVNSLCSKLAVETASSGSVLALVASGVNILVGSDISVGVGDGRKQPLRQASLGFAVMLCAMQQQQAGFRTAEAFSERDSRWSA